MFNLFILDHFGLFSFIASFLRYTGYLNFINGPISRVLLLILVVGKPNFSDQFKKIVKRYIRVGYNLDIMRQSACLVLNPITVYSYGLLFNCMMVGQASDSMMALT